MKGTTACRWVAALISLVVSSAAAAADSDRVMVGAPGTDAAGYPLETVDKRAVLRLLRARRFGELDAWLVDLQEQFEADSRKEYWPLDALDAFSNADPTLLPLLDAWVVDQPDSYMALAARGIYQVAIGWHRRGGKWANQTPPENFRRMLAAHRVAFPDLDEALTRHPSLVAGHRALIMAAQANCIPIPLRRRILDEALKVCPDCFQVRVTFMVSLVPRWGGSYARMRDFAEESARTSANAKMQTLAGFVDDDRCDLLNRKGGSSDAARVACDAAVSAGEYWTFRLNRAQLNLKSDPRAALADLNQAIELRPQNPQLLSERAWLLRRNRDYVGYARDIAVLKQIDPIDSLGKDDVASAAQGLEYAGSLRGKSGRPSDEIAMLERAIALDPDRLSSYLRLDAALVRTGQLAKIPPIWTRYLARHPNDARAHLERAGALHHLGQEPQALEDAAAACRLGEATGCSIARRGGR